MSQSGVIFGAIAVAFFVYITRKGELPIYAGLLLLSPKAATPSTTTAQSAASIVTGAFAALGL